MNFGKLIKLTIFYFLFAFAANTVYAEEQATDNLRPLKIYDDGTRSSHNPPAQQDITAEQRSEAENQYNLVEKVKVWALATLEKIKTALSPEQFQKAKKIFDSYWQKVHDATPPPEKHQP